MEKETKTIECHQCKTNACIGRYAEGMPDYCHARKFPGVVNSSKKQYYEPEMAKLHLATAKVLKNGGYDWPRIRQCIEFGKELGAKKVGLAVCAGLIQEGKEFARFLERAGFQVVSVICMVGAVDGEETGLPEEWVSKRGEKGLSDTPGVKDAFVNLANEQATLEYDPSKIDLTKIKDVVSGLGYGLATRKSIFPVRGMMCATCVAHVEEALRSVHGVISAAIAFSFAGRSCFP
jgi:copper chaperone CopZ